MCVRINFDWNISYINQNIIHCNTYDMRRTHASNKEEKKTVTAFKTRIDFSIAYTSHKCYVIFCRDLVKNLKLMRICDVIHYYCSINICRTKQWANMESWLKCSSFVIFVSNSTLSQFGIEYTPDLSYQRVIEFLKKISSKS